jgi:hypothetical protein
LGIERAEKVTESKEHEKVEGLQGLAVGRKQSEPTELASLEDAEGVGEGNAKSCGRTSWYGKQRRRAVRHGMIRMETKHGKAVGDEHMRAMISGLAKAEQWEQGRGQ